MVASNNSSDVRIAKELHFRLCFCLVLLGFVGPHSNIPHLQ